MRQLGRLGRRALVAPVLAGGLLLSGCWATHEEPDAAEIRLSPRATLFFGQVEETFEQLHGTPERRAARNQDRERADQERTVSCMSQWGFGYAVTSREILPTAAFYDPQWWTTPSIEQAAAGLGYAQPPVPLPSGHGPDYEALSPEQQAAYNLALASCSFDEGAPPTAELNPLADELSNSLRDRLLAAAQEPGFQKVRDAYARCLDGRGIQASEPGSLYDVAEQRLIDAGLYKGDPNSSDFALRLPALQKLESQVATADAECRAGLADDIADSLEPVLTRWLARHQHQLREAEETWNS